MLWHTFKFIIWATWVRFDLRYRDNFDISDYSMPQHIEQKKTVVKILERRVE